MAWSGATIASALGDAQRSIAIAEARTLLRHLLGCSHAALEIRRDRPLSAEQVEALERLVKRRVRGEPIAYLIGIREFYGRPFRVAPSVLIPRPETELLVDLALERLADAARPRILDLGTGSGVLAITLALECPRARVSAVNNAPAALAVAEGNAHALGASVSFLLGDWLCAFQRERFDAIVANPPYVAEGDPHLFAGDLPWEPTGALVSGADGLAALRRIIPDAPSYLNPGGWFLTEHGFDQAAVCRELLSEAGLAEVRSWRDLAGIERVSGGTLVRAA